MSSNVEPVYCVDTSALIAAWEERYPPDNFPRFWDRMNELCDTARLLFHESVLDETEKRSEELYRWLKARRNAIIGYETEVQTTAKEILSQYPLLVKATKSSFAADPFVIASAKVKGLIVLTEEAPSNSEKRPKMPDVCKGFEVSYINLIGFIRNEKWVIG